jgi:hypothetical protein
MRGAGGPGGGARLALEAGLSPAIADAIAANQPPASMAKDEETK